MGLPFAWDGYGEKGVSCWGLVVMFFADEFGITLPRHTDNVSLARAGRVKRADVWIDTPGLNKVDTIRSCDILHLRGFSSGGMNDLHCGIAVDGKRVLSANENMGSCVSNLYDSRYLNRFLGAYRVDGVEI